MFTSIPGLYPPCASPLPKCDNQKCLQTLLNVPWRRRAKSPAVEIYWSSGFRQKGNDEDSLLGQTLVRLLDLLLVPSVYFLIKSSFSKNPAKSV